MNLRNFDNIASNNPKAELTKMNEYSSELLRNPAFGRCSRTDRPFYASNLIFCASHPEVSLLLHEWSSFGSLEGFYDDLGTQLFNLWLEIVRFLPIIPLKIEFLLTDRCFGQMLSVSGVFKI
jgi:hypothetical protein